MKNISEVVPEDESPLLILVQRHGEERLVLGTNPSVPLALKVVIVDQSGIATVVVLFVVFLDSLQIAVCMDVRREDKNASRVRIAKVCGGGDREGSNRDGLASTDHIFFERDWDGEQLLFLLLVFACLYDVGDGASIKPKCVAAVGKGELIRLRPRGDR